MKRQLATAVAVAAAILEGCSSDPTAADKTEGGVKAALTQYVEIGVHGDRSAEDQELYCTQLITAEEADITECEPPYGHTQNSSWREIVSIDSVAIDGDMATIHWYWRGKNSTTQATSETTSHFYWEGSRWRYQYDK